MLSSFYHRGSNRLNYNSYTDKSLPIIHLSSVLFLTIIIQTLVLQLLYINETKFWFVYRSAYRQLLSESTDHVWWTGEGSSRCSGSSFPSSCPVYTGSHVRGWTVGQTLRWHTGSWHQGPASRCHCPLHTDAKSADVDYKSHRSSMSLRPSSSLCRPV